MIWFEFVTLLLYSILQVKANTNAKERSVVHKCLEKYPDVKALLSSTMSECIFTDIEVLDSFGMIDRNKLKKLLEIRYKDPKFISQLVDLCGIQKASNAETAYFVYYSCWFTHYESLNEARNHITLLSCWFSWYKTHNDIPKCFLQSIHIIDEKGKVNKKSLLQLMKEEKGKEFEEKMILSCATEKKDPAETASNIWRCLNS